MTFDSHIDFDPAGDLAAMLARIPAKWVVYLMSDGDGHPVQLLCVKDLRASLQHRLGDNEQLGPSRRVGYRDLVRHIAWRRVDSAFEADHIYLELAREIFPHTYRDMLAFKEAWFLHVDSAEPFPRFTKTNDPARAGGELIGPIQDKHAAGRLIELIEDTFDLCRYYNVLTVAPAGKACAYKEMGRCAAPCDGSAPMEDYRALVRRSVTALLHSQEYRAECEAQMRQASAALNFEVAGKIKTHLDRESRLHAGAFSDLRSLRDFRFVSMQRGPGEKKARIFLITPSRIDEILDIPRTPAGWSEIDKYLHERMENFDGEIDLPAAERIAIVASHLFMPKKQGVMLKWEDVSEKTLAAAYRSISSAFDQQASIDENSSWQETSV